MKNRSNKVNPEGFFRLSTNEKLNYLVFLAALAPSTHNTQPWQFIISSNPCTIEVHSNSQRHLKASDKDGRQLYLSVGAAITNLILAAQALGLPHSIKYENTLSSGKIATITFADLKNTSEIDLKTLEALHNRHNNRSPFDNQALPELFFETIQKICQNDVNATITTDTEQKKRIQDLVEEAVEKAFQDKGFTEELSHWIKPSLKKYNDGMPGYNLGMPWFISLVMPWAIKNIPMAKAQRKMNAKMLAHAAAFVTLSTEQDDPNSWIKAGSILERIFIEAEKNNIKIGVMAAPIETGEYYKKLQTILNISTRPQVFFRIGYSKQIPKFSPRLSLNQIIVQ